ncbi:MAG TPA: TerC family protein [Phycisphaerales bacterium]|nr:TerC family protein [Phycisphaerales bacterium]
MEWLTTESIIGLVMLTLLEIILGIDNIVFITVLTGKLPDTQRAKAVFIGLAAAMGLRIVMLIGISWIMRLDSPIVSVLGTDLSIKDFILLVGGLFLVAKATHEIHLAVEGRPERSDKEPTSLSHVVMQIIVLDAIFSIDSVITAVGMANELWVMITAIVLSVLVMMAFASPIGNFVHRHPAMKVLALAFLVLIGVALMADGFHVDLHKGYIYSAMGFALVVEMLQLRMSKNQLRRTRKAERTEARIPTQPKQQ